MNTAYLLIGGNLGNREEQLSIAKELIEEQCGEITQLSSIYETAAWGKTDQPAFLNQALALRTTMNAQRLIRCLLKVEKIMGRLRVEKFGPRLIDIDILLFNNEIHQQDFLVVPHPALQHRRFALLPLTQIAPGIIHPILNKSIQQLLEECPDPLPVIKYS